MLQRAGMLIVLKARSTIGAGRSRLNRSLRLRLFVFGAGTFGCLDECHVENGMAHTKGLWLSAGVERSISSSIFNG